MGDTLVTRRDKRQLTGDGIDRGIRHDPCGPCSVRGLSWILRERSPRDVGLIGTSLVSQEGRKEQFRARRSEMIGRPERPP